MAISPRTVLDLNPALVMGKPGFEGSNKLPMQSIKDRRVPELGAVDLKRNNFL